MFGYFQCTLPQDTINVDVTMRTLGGINKFRKDHSTQSTTCSPWSIQVKPLPLLLKKMETFMDEKRRIENPFFPTQVVSLFLNKKTTTTKRSEIDTKRSQKKHRKTRKLDMRCFVPTKAAMPTSPQPLAKTVVPANTTIVTGIFTQPDTQTQQFCAPSGKLCSFTSLIHSDWSDIEEDCNGERQKEREQRKKEQAEKEKADKEQNNVQKDLEGKLIVDKYHITHLVHNMSPPMKVKLPQSLLTH